MNRVTINDIADNLNTSVATVSRALNGRKRVSEKTRQEVLREARRLGYKPKMQVPARTVGLLSTLLIDYAARVDTTLTRVFSDRGWVAETYTPDNAERVLDRLLDGLVVAVDPADTGLPQEQLGVFPTVLFNWPGEGRFQGVVSDHAESGYLGTRELLDAGHRRIAFVGGPLPEWAVKARLMGARRALDERGLELDERMLFIDLDDRKAVDEAMAGEPTAVFALEENVSPYAISAIQGKYRRRIPEDISFLGFHIGEQPMPYYPEMTVIRQPIEEMALKAVELLERLAEKPTLAPETYVFPNRFERGDSVGPPR